jgi:hypothetical protein
MRLSILFFLVVLVLADVPLEIANCFEGKDCGVESLGSYLLPYVDKEEDTNKTISGFLFKVENGLPFDLTLYWDVIGAVLDTGLVEEHKQLFVVKASSTRLIDTHVYGTQTFRLFVKDTSPVTTSGGLSYEQIDRTVGYGEKKIGKRSKICDYLLKLCYDKIAGDYCPKYSLACNGFEIKTEEEELMETYILKYYSHLLDVPDKEAFKIDHLSMVKCVIDQQKIIKAKLNSGKNNRWDYYQGKLMSTDEVDIIKKTDDAEIHAAQTTTAVLAVFLGIIIITFIVILVYKYDCSHFHHYYNKVWTKEKQDNNPGSRI